MKNVLVTGADRGLGVELCRCFLKDGGYRVFAGQFMPEWPQLGELLEEYGSDKLVIVPLDIGSTESVENAYKMVSEVTDSLDILVNNAGISGKGEGDMLKDIDASHTVDPFNVNCVGSLRMTEIFLPLIEKSEKKRICFVSSEAGCVSICHRDGIGGYFMSKAALNMEIRLIFNELVPKGFTIRVFHPGWMRTYMGGQKSTMGNLEPEESAPAAYEQFVTDTEFEDRLYMRDNVHEIWPF